MKKISKVKKQTKPPPKKKKPTKKQNQNCKQKQKPFASLRTLLSFWYFIGHGVYSITLLLLLQKSHDMNSPPLLSLPFLCSILVPITYRHLRHIISFNLHYNLQIRHYYPIFQMRKLRLQKLIFSDWFSWKLGQILRQKISTCALLFSLLLHQQQNILSGEFCKNSSHTSAGCSLVLKGLLNGPRLGIQGVAFFRDWTKTHALP